MNNDLSILKARLGKELRALAKLNTELWNILVEAPEARIPDIISSI